MTLLLIWRISMQIINLLNFFRIKKKISARFRVYDGGGLFGLLRVKLNTHVLCYGRIEICPHWHVDHHPECGRRYKEATVGSIITRA